MLISAWRCHILCPRTSVKSSSALKTVSLGAMPVESMLTSMDLIVTSSRIFRIVFPFGSISSFAGKFAAVLISPGMCAISKLKWSTKLHAFDSGCGIIFVLKTLVTDLLSVLMMVGLLAPWKLCPKLFSAK